MRVLRTARLGVERRFRSRDRCAPRDVPRDRLVLRGARGLRRASDRRRYRAHGARVSRQRQRARAMCSPSCSSPLRAAEYLGWHGNLHAFDFVSPVYSRAFLVGNAQKLVNLTPEGRAILESSIAEQHQGIDAARAQVRVIREDDEYVSAPRSPAPCTAGCKHSLRSRGSTRSTRSSPAVPRATTDRSGVLGTGMAARAFVQVDVIKVRPAQWPARRGRARGHRDQPARVGMELRVRLVHVGAANRCPRATLGRRMPRVQR